jgi:hypothetical protein
LQKPLITRDNLSIINKPGCVREFDIFYNSSCMVHLNGYFRLLRNYNSILKVFELICNQGTMSILKTNRILLLMIKGKAFYNVRVLLHGIVKRFEVML